MFTVSSDHIIQEPTEPVNAGPWLADNQSRDVNNKFWLVVYLVRSLPDIIIYEIHVHKDHLELITSQFSFYRYKRKKESASVHGRSSEYLW